MFFLSLSLSYIYLWIEFYIILFKFIILLISLWLILWLVKQIKLPAGHCGLYSESSAFIDKCFYFLNYILYVFIYIYMLF